MSDGCSTTRDAFKREWAVRSPQDLRKRCRELDAGRYLVEGLLQTRCKVTPWLKSLFSCCGQWSPGVFRTCPVVGHNLLRMQLRRSSNPSCRLGVPRFTLKYEVYLPRLTWIVALPAGEIRIESLLMPQLKEIVLLIPPCT